MKKHKLLAVLLTALFLAPFFPARAETVPAFTVNEGAVLKGMDRSWRQGYTAAVSGNKWTLVLPVQSEAAAGSLKAELAVKDERTTPFKPQVIFIGKPIEMDDEVFMKKLAKLDDDSQEDDENIREYVMDIVPTYHPNTF